MKISDYKNGKLILLSTAFDSKAKMLYCFYFLVFFGTGATFLRLFIESYHPGIVAIALSLGFATALFVCAYRFANKAVMSEQLFINNEVLQWIRKGLFSSDVRSYLVSDISNLRHLKKPESTQHPLAGQTFDYLGFQTEQQVINEMHGDNRMAFDWKGRTITFGQEVYSWEFETIGTLLREVTGRSFGRREDAFEEIFGPIERKDDEALPTP